MSLCSLFVSEQIFSCLSIILKPKFILLLTVKDECSLCQVCVCVFFDQKAWTAYSLFPTCMLPTAVCCHVELGEISSF